MDQLILSNIACGSVKWYNHVWKLTVSSKVKSKFAPRVIRIFPAKRNGQICPGRDMNKNVNRMMHESNIKAMQIPSSRGWINYLWYIHIRVLKKINFPSDTFENMGGFPKHYSKWQNLTQILHIVLFHLCKFQKKKDLIGWYDQVTVCGDGDWLKRSSGAHSGIMEVGRLRWLVHRWIYQNLSNHTIKLTEFHCV